MESNVTVSMELVVKGRRTKEDLIAAQRDAQTFGSESMQRIEVVARSAARMLKDGFADGALQTLARAAVRFWRKETLAGFDLRRVDEQGRLIEPGWLALPAAPSSRKCLALTSYGVQCQAPVTHAGHAAENPRCFDCAPGHYQPIPGVCLTWTAGEHLDDVIAQGAKLISASATASLFQWFFAQPIESTVHVPADLGEGTIGHLLGADPRASAQPFRVTSRTSIDLLRVKLRERGYDVVPLLRWEDVASWLTTRGFKITLWEVGATAKRGEDAMSWRFSSPPDDHTFEMIGGMVDMSVREVRTAIEAHVADRKVPTTRAECLAALGIEPGREYPGLWERLAGWLHLPLTEEESKARAETARTLNTRACDACRDRAGLAAEVFECGGCHKAIPKIDGYASDEGWRCAACTVTSLSGALNAIAAMFEVPAGDLTKVVPAAVRLHLVNDIAQKTIAVALDQKLSLSATVGVLSRELERRKIWSDTTTRAQRVRAIVEAYRGRKDALAEVDRFTREDSATCAPPGAVFDEVRRFTDDDARAIQERLRERPRGQGILVAAPPVEVVLPTFAELRAAAPHATVFVLEPDTNRAACLLEHLFSLGGEHEPFGEAIDRIGFGTVRVYVTMDPARAASCRADVAVGFDEQTSHVLTQGSSIRIAIHADDALRFWGLA